MTSSSKKYHLIAELLSTLQAEGYPLGTGQQLQVQELLNKLPEDTTLEEMPFLLAPLFANNPKEQAHFYELFEQCRKRTEAFYLEIEREELVAPDRQERRYRGLIWSLLLLLLIPPAIVIYQLMKPVERDFIEKPFQVQAGGQAEVCLSDSTDLKGFGAPAGYEVLYSGRGKLGAFQIKSPGCLVYISQELINGQDSIVVEWSNNQGGKLQVRYKPIIVLPEPDTLPPLPEESAEIIKPFSSPFKTLNYPSNHDPLAFAVQPPSALRLFLANNFQWLKWGGLLLFTALLLTVLFYRAYRRRKLVAELEANDRPPYAWNIRIEGAEAIQMGDEFGYLLNLIRQRTGSEAFKLDVPRTIGATIEQGGMPTFRYLQQTQPPEYLLLIDQQTAHNHRARLLDMLFQVFHANEVLIERFFYDNDPRVCYNEMYPEGIPLQEVQQRYGGARLIVVGYGNALLNKLTGKPEPWSRLFRNWKHRLLLTPRPTESWGKRERRLEEVFTLLPLSMQGLLFWLGEMEMEEDARFDTWPDRIKDAPKNPVELNGALVPSLRAHFSEPMLQWIAACAVYPSLHWDLTLYLGQQLSAGRESLLTVNNLLELTRLPWFTEGRIPQAARLSLLGWMEAEHPALLEQLRTQLVDILQQNPPPSDSAAFEDYRMNVALNEWLTTRNKQRKKELEKEIGRLIEAGAEADITVIKQLQRERHPLDFIVPDTWKKYLHPHGLPGLGWHGEWRDVLRGALPLWILALLITAWPWQIRPTECTGPLIDYHLRGKDYLLCLKDQQALWVMLEEHARAAVAMDSLSGAKATNQAVMSWMGGQAREVRLPLSANGREASWEWRAGQLNNWGGARVEAPEGYFILSGQEATAIPQGWRDEYRSNMAIAFYNRGAELFQWSSDFTDMAPDEREGQLRVFFEEWKKIEAGASELSQDLQQTILKAVGQMGLKLGGEQASFEALAGKYEQILAAIRQGICGYFQEAVRLDSTQFEFEIPRIHNWCAGDIAADTIHQDTCYVISDIASEVDLLSRKPAREEADELNAAQGKPGLDKLRLKRPAPASSVRAGEQVRLLEEGPYYYHISYKGTEGYMVKMYKGEPILRPCSESKPAEDSPEPLRPAKEIEALGANADSAVVILPERQGIAPNLPLRQNTSLQTGKGKPEGLDPAIKQRLAKAHTPRYLWCLDNPHGKDTPGKRSPVFDDGKTQLFEYELSRDVVGRIMRRLEEIGVAYYQVVPEEEDISLQERAGRINTYNSRLPKLAVSVHFNAGTPEGGAAGWTQDGARGAEAWYYGKSRNGRRLGAVFLEKILRKTELPNRFLKESAQFTLLNNVQSPVTQIENGFYNNRAEAVLLAQPAFRQRLADAYVEAILEIEANGLEKTPASLIDEKDSDEDGVANSEDLCPFTAGPTENKGCPQNKPDDGSEIIPDQIIVVANESESKNSPPKKGNTPYSYLWCLDNAHGKDTPKKRSPVFDDGKTQLFEYELSRDLVKRITRRLDSIGISYYLVVPEEKDISIEDRARRINEYSSKLPKLAVSIHFNSAPARNESTWGPESVEGVESWFPRNSEISQRLAAVFQKKIVQKTNFRNRHLKYMPDNDDQFPLFEKVNVPITLIENGFLNTRSDAALLARPGFIEKLAEAYVEAILEIESNGL